MYPLFKKEEQWNVYACRVLGKYCTSFCTSYFRWCYLAGHGESSNLYKRKNKAQYDCSTAWTFNFCFCRSISQLHNPPPFFSPLKVRYHFFIMFSVFHANSFCLKIFMCHSYICRLKHLSEASITQWQLTPGHKGDLFHNNNPFPFTVITRIRSTFSLSLPEV